MFSSYVSCGDLLIYVNVKENSEKEMEFGFLNLYIFG